MKKHNYSVVSNIYVGNGEKAEKLRERMGQRSIELNFRSVSAYVMGMIKKGDPELFKNTGDKNGK